MLRVIVCVKMFELSRINADIFHVSVPLVYCPEFTYTIITFYFLFPVCTSLCYCPFLLLSEFTWTVLSNLYFIFCLIIVTLTWPLLYCPSFILSPFLLSSCSHPRYCLHFPRFTCVVFSSARCAALCDLLCILVLFQSLACFLSCNRNVLYYLLTVLLQTHRCDTNSVILKTEVGSQHVSLSTSGWKNCDLSKKDPFCKMFALVWLKGNTEIRFLELRFPSGAFSGLHNQLVYSVLC